MIKHYEKWDDDWHTLEWVCDTEEEADRAMQYAQYVADTYGELSTTEKWYEKGVWIVEVTYLDL